MTPRFLQGLRRIPAPLLALVAGLAAGLAHPPVGFLPGLLGYALILGLCLTAPNLRSAFWRGWLAGLAYFSVSCWWIYEAFQVDAEAYGGLGALAVGAMATGLALFWAVAAMVVRWANLKSPLAVVVFAGAFASLEWLRGHLFTGFPWNLVGETWKAGGMLSQSASVFGVYGLTWITLAACASPALVVLRPRRSSLVAVILAAASLAGLAGFGAWRLQTEPDIPGKNITVRIVQANFSEVADYDQARFQLMLDRYIALTTQPSQLGAPPQFVFWPEGALPASANALLAEGSATRTAILRALTPGQTLIMGGYTIQGTLENPLYYNSLLALFRTGSDLEVAGAYDKHRLVPFGEYPPPFLKALGLSQIVPVPGAFQSGPEPAAIDIGALIIQPLICYESLFPGFTRSGERRTGRRADLIVNLSNDGWFGLTSGPLQHFNLASYRAIEEGLPMIRSTPNGVSAIIDAHGRVVQGEYLGLDQMGVVDADVNTVQFDTFYRRMGDMPFGVMLLISLLAWLANRLGKSRRA